MKDIIKSEQTQILEAKESTTQPMVVGTPKIRIGKYFQKPTSLRPLRSLGKLRGLKAQSLRPAISNK